MVRIAAIALIAAGLVAVAAADPEPAVARPIGGRTVGIAASPIGSGYWEVTDTGVVDAIGTVPFLGSMAGNPLQRPIVGIAATPSGRGYWLVASDGGVFTFGDAAFLGSTGDLRLNRPIVGMAATTSGLGYWLVASDGGMFAFGDAPYLGSTGDLRLNRPIVGMATSWTGDGYWLVATDGGIFAFGDAPFLGSTGDLVLNRPIVGMAAAAAGDGYRLAASDGGLFSFGDAPFPGSAAELAPPSPITGMVPAPPSKASDGVWLVAADGSIYSLGDAPYFGSASLLDPVPADAALPLSVTPLVTGLDIPWDLQFTPDGTMLFDQRAGTISARLPSGEVRQLAVADVHSEAEMGLLGLAVDPDFATTRAFYTCQVNDTPRDERVVRWTVDAGYTKATPDAVPLLTGIPAYYPTHNGCRIRVGPDGALWIGTGDTGLDDVPQDLSSLAGKVLRIDRTTGAPAPGNPDPSSPVYTYGHRNVEGLAFRPGTDQAYSVEHGTYRDDEINRLTPGANFGWNAAGYANDQAPMTDLDRYPSATSPVWTSSNPTLATSGATFVTGSAWGPWDGALVVACLKASELHVVWLSAEGRAVAETVGLVGFGRLRTVEQGPDGALYVTTSNGKGADRILRVAPAALG